MWDATVLGASIRGRQSGQNVSDPRYVLGQGNLRRGDLRVTFLFPLDGDPALIPGIVQTGELISNRNLSVAKHHELPVFIAARRPPGILHMHVREARSKGIHHLGR